MVTIKQIAERANVSTATVSNVIHGKINKVSPANVEKIQNLIKEMGYVQHLGLRVLQKGGTQLVAVIVNYRQDYQDSSLVDPFYGAVVGAIEQQLQSAGYYMLFYASDNIDDIFNMVMSWDVDGVIAVTFTHYTCEKLYRRINKPMVSIDAFGDYGEALMVPDIGLDDVNGGFLAGQYLLELGYEKIYFCSTQVVTARTTDVESSRWMGMCKAWEGSPYKTASNKPRLKHIGCSRESQKKFVLEFIRQMPRKEKTALFFISDRIAMEASRRILEHGYSIPKDVGIMGYDDSDYAAKFSLPRLTTIHQDAGLKGKKAVDELVGMIRDAGYPGNSHVLPVLLKKRDSV